MGGFASSIAVKRIPAPEHAPVFVEPEPAIVEPEIAFEEPQVVFDERKLVEMLLEATRAANLIRRAAILDLKQARQTLDVPAVRAEARAAIDALSEELLLVRARLGPR